MPELPEVETVRRGIAPVLDGALILRAEARRPDLRWPLPENFAERLTGRTAVALRRRSKYILVDLSPAPGAPAETWIIHLGMSGRIVVDNGASAHVVGEFAHETGVDAASTPGGPIPAHDHVVVETDRGLLVYNDPRRFGAMDLWPTDALSDHRLLADIGPEPLEPGFDADHLIERFRGKTASIKAALLDQRIVAGLGNIYVCEALFRAGVNPKRAAGGLSPTRVARLVQCVREVLAEAIEAGGSSLKDYRQADGALGYFQHNFAVYGREGEACARDGCAGHVRRIVQTGRSTFYCPKCQR